MRFTRPVGVAALALAAAACGGSGGGYTTSNTGGGTPPPPANQVNMQASTFNPASLTVAVGTTVTWSNQDAFGHTVTYSSGPGTAFSGSVAGGATFTHQFTAAGTYQYYCTIHGTPTSGMRGTIVAQ